MTATETAFYDRPDWYDLLHAAGTADEVWLLERLNALHGTGGKRWLEPACGTGRYLAALSKKGYRVTGYDSNEKMLAYARRRLSGSADVLRADMASFRRPGRFDLAFCLLSTFRHLLTAEKAAKHLELIAESLKPGGLYILGLDLTDYRDAHDDEEAWTARRGRRSAEHVVLSLAPQAPRRRERIINLLTLTCGGKKEFLESAYDLRSYDARQLRALVRASPLSLEAVYGPDGKPSRLGPETRDAFFVLKKG
jgi:SAM-dependent methyltransferase